VADIMSPEKRSALMSRIRGRNTAPERRIFGLLRRRGVAFSRHATAIPGTPDIAFKRLRLAIFIDGDFWHGWRFPAWEAKLGTFWRNKIRTNRERDRRTFRKLRRQGWVVVRFWEHQVESGAEACAERVLSIRRTLMAKHRSERRSGSRPGRRT